jgi:hypothetical protein
MTATGCVPPRLGHTGALYFALNRKHDVELYRATDEPRPCHGHHPNKGKPLLAKLVPLLSTGKPDCFPLRPRGRSHADHSVVLEPRNMDAMTILYFIYDKP